MMGPTPFHIRSFDAADAPSVIALWNEVLPPNAPHNDPATAIQRKTDHDGELFYVAVVDSLVVGTVMGGYDGHRGWIYSMAVAPDHQRLGIGSALIAHLEDALVNLGCLKINLQVRESNQGVIAFYERLGYQVDKVVGMGKRMYDAGEPDSP